MTLGESTAASIANPRHRRGAAQVYGIDFLRVAAAMFVAIYHLTFTSWASPERHGDIAPLLAYKPLAVLTSSGWVGVEIFFVISGYVIALSANGRTPIGFVNSRLLRLVPGVFACATLTIPALIYFGQDAADIAARYFRSILFWPFPTWVAGPYWTLCVELAFYALVLIALLFDRFSKIETILYAIGAVSCALWFLHLALPDGQGARAITWLLTKRPGQLLLLRHGMFFAIGVVAWLIRTNGLTGRRLFALLILSVGGLIEISAQADATAHYMNHPVSRIVSCAIWLGSMAVMAISIRYNDRISGALQNRRWLVRALGLATYPLYLLHEPIGIALLLAGFGVGLAAWPLLAGTFTLVMGIALVVALYIEPALRAPVSRWLTALESHRLSAGLRKPTTPIG